MKAKATVRIEGCCFEIGYAAGVVSEIISKSAAELVITSARDSTHSANSLHYKGRAIDVRSKTLPFPVRSEIFGDIKRVLEPQGFDVLDEGDHFHIEFDPKAGERFITIVA